MGNCISRGSHTHPGNPMGDAANDSIALAATNHPVATPAYHASRTGPHGKDATPGNEASAIVPHSSKGVEIPSTNNLQDNASPGTTNRRGENHEARQRAQSKQPAPNDDGKGRAYRELSISKNNGVVATPPGAISTPGDQANPIGLGSSGEGRIADDDGFKMTVLPANTEPDPASPEEEARWGNLREKCPRFRILVIGKANAGKTTILQKMCNTTEAPIIEDQDGNVLDPSIINPTNGRGIHDINNELTFSTNSGFVFHDSAGFEAGSTTELEAVRKFMAERAVANDLQEQLHAIWYCLPTDNDRPLSNAEMSFFEQGTGRVPVIAIFTKYDGMILKEYNRLRYEEQCTKQDARIQAPLCAESTFMTSEHYLKKLQAAPYPPSKYLRVQRMDKPESNCTDLSRQTLEALDSKKLRLLFVSVQQVNVELCTEYALGEFVLNVLAESARMTTNNITVQLKMMILCFGHLAYNKDDSQLQRPSQFFQFFERQALGITLDSILASLNHSHPLPLQILMVATSLLIAAEDSLWAKEQGLPNHEALKVAWDNYQASGKAPDVTNRLKVLSQVNFQMVRDNREGKEWVQRMCTIINEFKVHP